MIDNELTALAQESFNEFYDLFGDLDHRIVLFDREIDRVFRESDARQCIAKIKRVGPTTGAAIIAAVGDGSTCKNGRRLGARVGFLPRQFSGGDRKVLTNISKRGNQHRRCLLVHRARVSFNLGNG